MSEKDPSHVLVRLLKDRYLKHNILEDISSHLRLQVSNSTNVSVLHLRSGSNRVRKSAVKIVDNGLHILQQEFATKT